MREANKVVDRPPDCILAVSDDGFTGTGVVLTDPEPEGEGDAIYVQYLQTEYEPNYEPSKKHIGKQFSHIRKCHLLQKVFKLQLLWSSHWFIKQG